MTSFTEHSDQWSVQDGLESNKRRSQIASCIHSVCLLPVGLTLHDVLHRLLRCIPLGDSHGRTGGSAEGSLQTYTEVG